MIINKKRTQIKVTYEELATEDFQNRNGSCPESDIADFIWVNVNEISAVMEISFKNTSEETAIIWSRKTCETKGIQFNQKVVAAQTGDYHDDWVDARVEFIF